MRTYYRCIVENHVAEVGNVYIIRRHFNSIEIEVHSGVYTFVKESFLSSHFEVATCKDYIAQIHDSVIRNPFTFDYVDPNENKAYKTEKKPPQYIDWAELVLEAYCN